MLKLHNNFKNISQSQKKRQQEELSNFAKRRENGELLIQKTARLYDNFLAPIQEQRMAEKLFIAVGQTIQLIACDMAETSEPLTLSVVVNEPYINRCHEIDEHCGLSCAPSTRAIARNSFVVRRAIDRHALDKSSQSSTATEFLKYGQDIILECYGTDKQQRPILVYSMPRNPFASDQCCDNNVVFKANGQAKQFVGLALQKLANNEMPTSSDASIPVAFFHWRFYHINPEIRFETMGENIPVCVFV